MVIFNKSHVKNHMELWIFKLKNWAHSNESHSQKSLGLNQGHIRWGFGKTMRLCIRPDCQFRVCTTNITGYFIDRLNGFCFQCILESQSGPRHCKICEKNRKLRKLKIFNFKIIFIREVFFQLFCRFLNPNNFFQFEL